jgi:SNF family Na+-dependent transporter
MLLLVGMPLMFMELAFGQYASIGPIAIFEKFCPLFSGEFRPAIMVRQVTCNVSLQFLIHGNPSQELERSD